MSTRQMKIGDVRQIGFLLVTQWESLKDRVTVSGKSMYALIALKRTLEAKFQEINETFLEVGQRHGGYANEQGNLQIPEDKIETVNTELTEIANEMIDIDYREILLRDGDYLPPELMEALFEFIEVE